MNQELTLASDLGTYLADGSRAAEYRLQRIEPILGVYDLVILDLENVRGMNSSFANALLVPLIVNHGQEILQKLRFRHCNPLVKLMLEAALAMGVRSAIANAAHA